MSFGHPGSLFMGRGHSCLSQNEHSLIPIGTKAERLHRAREGEKWVAVRDWLTFPYELPLRPTQSGFG